MRVLISGASGLVGTELKLQLKALGHEPVSLVRRDAKNKTEVSWDPASGRIPADAMDTIDAVVNLGGATTGKIPWTKKYKEILISSRLDSTKTLVEAINNASKKPTVLISGSASGFYGECGEKEVTEADPKGSGFLSDLAEAWEKKALQANTRVVLIRTTLVMSKKLGALGKLVPLIKLGIGGPLGSGKQWWAWISLEDEVRAILHLIENQSTEGAYNLTAPEPATCAQMVNELGHQLKRPTFLKVPAWAMRLLIGEAAQELLLCSQKMKSHRLIDSGFEFKHPSLKESVEYVLN